VDQPVANPPLLAAHALMPVVENPVAEKEVLAARTVVGAGS
jgi:hypothetical protein